MHPTFVVRFLRFAVVLGFSTFSIAASSVAANDYNRGSPDWNRAGRRNRGAQPALGEFSGTGQSTPVCLSSHQPIPVDNQEVLGWKTGTANLFLARSHVQGRVTRVYPDRNGHNHFAIQIGPGPSDTLEVIYNSSFGQLPNIRPGMSVEACGDYITSNAPAQYPASPDGAIIHWVHRNPRGGHDSGFLVINGSLYGQGNGSGGG